jgi:hypothetical protein
MISLGTDSLSKPYSPYGACGLVLQFMDNNEFLDTPQMRKKDIKVYQQLGTEEIEA